MRYIEFDFPNPSLCDSTPRFFLTGWSASTPPPDGRAADHRGRNLTVVVGTSRRVPMQPRSTRSSARSALAPVERSNASVESSTPRLKKTKSAATPGSRGKSGAARCQNQGLYGRPARLQAADWPRVCWLLRRGLALRGASGEPAGRSLSILLTAQARRTASRKRRRCSRVRGARAPSVAASRTAPCAWTSAAPRAAPSSWAARTPSVGSASPRTRRGRCGTGGQG